MRLCAPYSFCLLLPTGGIEMAKVLKLPYLLELVGTFLLPLLIVLLCLPLRDWISPTDVAMLQLLWVAWQAQQYGWRWATLAMP